MSDQLSDLAPIALVHCDAGSVIQNMNDAAQSLLGQSKSKLLGQNLTAAIYGASDIFPLIEEALSTQIPIAAQNVAVGGPKIAVRAIDVRLSPVSGRVCDRCIVSGQSNGGGCPCWDGGLCQDPRP